MGIQFKDLIQGKEVEIKELQNKVLAVDTSNMLYQFLSSIRSRDGQLLMDSNGQVTSHLQGLFARVTNFVDSGMKLCFILDGPPPELKRKEQQRRRGIKIDAQNKYNLAKQKGDLTDMKKFASRTSRLTQEMVNEASRLLKAFGIPVIQAPSEADSQAAFLVKENDAYAVASQDYDGLLHGSFRLLKNLSIAGKRKKQNTLAFTTVKPEIISLSDTLNKLGIDQDQLIALATLIGTDYNIGGIKGIGPVNALKLVKQFGDNFDNLFKEVKWDDFFDYEWTDVFYTIKKMEVKKDYELKWNPIDSDAIIKLLCDEHDFSKERVEKTITKLTKGAESQTQRGLADFI